MTDRSETTNTLSRRKVLARLGLAAAAAYAAPVALNLGQARASGYSGGGRRSYSGGGRRRSYSRG